MTSNFNIPRKDREIIPRTDGCVATLVSNPDKLLIAVSDGRIRKLTPREYDALMSWEKDYTSKGLVNGEVIDIPKSARYIRGGNGVVSAVVKKIISTIYP